MTPFANSDTDRFQSKNWQSISIKGMATYDDWSSIELLSLASSKLFIPDGIDTRFSQRILIMHIKQQFWTILGFGYADWSERISVGAHGLG